MFDRIFPLSNVPKNMCYINCWCLLKFCNKTSKYKNSCQEIWRVYEKYKTCVKTVTDNQHKTSMPRS